MHHIFKVSILLSLFISSPGFAALTREAYVSQISKVVEKESVLFIGEAHDVEGHVEFLPDLVKKLVDEGKIEFFATESIHELGNRWTASYVSDSSVKIGTKRESDYFNRMHPFGWTSSVSIRRLYRTLRELKLRHGDKFAFCGIDAIPLTDENLGLPSEDSEEKKSAERRKWMRIEALDLYPQALIEKLAELLGLNVEQLFERPDPYFIRESKMAFNAAQCAKGKKKGIIHAGGGHLISRKEAADEGPDEKGHRWWMTSSYFQLLRPDLDFATLEMATTQPGREREGYYERFRIATEVLGLSDFRLYTSEQLPEKVKRILTENVKGEVTNHWRRYDYWIFGPMDRPRKSIYNTK